MRNLNFRRAAVGEKYPGKKKQEKEKKKKHASGFWSPKYEALIMFIILLKNAVREVKRTRVFLNEAFLFAALLLFNTLSWAE